MFKADNLKEATDLATSFRVHKEQLAALDNETTLTVSFGTRTVHLKEGDPKYSEVKNAMRVFLQLRIDNCKRRAAQLDFLLEPVVYPKIERTVSAPNLIHSLDKGPSIADEAEALFGKPVLR